MTSTSEILDVVLKLMALFLWLIMSYSDFEYAEPGLLLIDVASALLVSVPGPAPGP